VNRKAVLRPNYFVKQGNRVSVELVSRLASTELLSSIDWAARILYEVRALCLPQPDSPLVSETRSS
jgi:hypothetical protein